MSSVFFKAKSTDLSEVIEQGKGLFPWNFYIVSNVEDPPDFLLTPYAPKPEYGKKVTFFDYDYMHLDGSRYPSPRELWEVPTKEACDDIMSGGNVGGHRYYSRFCAKEFVSGDLMRKWEEHSKRKNISDCPHCGHSRSINDVRALREEMGY